MKKLFALLLAFLTLGSCQKEKKDWQVTAKNPENLHRSVRQVTDVIVHDIFSPPVAARIYAYMSIAAYEAAIQDDSRYASLANQLNGLEATPKPEPGVEYCFQLS